MTVFHSRHVANQNAPTLVLAWYRIILWAILLAFCTGTWSAFLWLVAYELRQALGGI